MGRRGDGLRPHAGGPGIPSQQALPGSLLSSQVWVAPLALRGLQSRVSDSAMIDKPEPRRFPPPWIAEETDACFIVRDASRQALAYVYFEEEPGRRSAAKLLTRDEARAFAANIAELPEMLRSRGAPETTSCLLWPGAGPSAAKGYPLS
jgi:hypothetical protein